MWGSCITVRNLLLAGFAGLAAAAAVDFEGLFSAGRNNPAIGYAVRPAHNAITELNAKMRAGAVRLAYDHQSGYVGSVLEALDIPVESQMLVFSKTSLMQQLISPRHPRSIFFNDSVAVGWVPGEPFVEVAAEDREQGVIFYTLDQKLPDAPYGLDATSPLFTRRNDCLSCHESYSSLGVPGMLVRSVFPAANGYSVRTLGDFISDHRSPFHERWGGWYVTGKTGSLVHMGNQTFADTGDSDPVLKPAALDSLQDRFDTGAYLSPYSDVVALLVFEHQMHMVNLFTRIGWEIRAADSPAVRAAVLRDGAAEIADYMLFIDEAPLSGRVTGASGFAEWFSRQGPRDSQGRSLRQLDLERRLMRYPCSYMIYSAAFDGLPPEAKVAICRRMSRILTGEEKAPKYARLSPADRQAILEILHETKKDLQ